MTASVSVRNQKERLLRKRKVTRFRQYVESNFMERMAFSAALHTPGYSNPTKEKDRDLSRSIVKWSVDVRLCLVTTGRMITG